MALPDPLIHVIDDDKAVRDSLGWLLGSVGHAVLCHDSADEFLEIYEKDLPGCVLVDVRMPGMSGLELQKELAAQAPNLPVIVITGHGDVQMAVEAMKTGAYDFVQKPFNDQILVDLVQKAIDQSCSSLRDGALRGEVLKRVDRLTLRERQVLDLVVAGESNKRIAYHLDLSEKTIEAHRASMMEKMGARSLAELMKLVFLANPAAGAP